MHRSLKGLEVERERVVVQHEMTLEPTPLHKLPRGHTPWRHTLVMRDKRLRRGKDKLRREFGV